jgi:mannose-6-phosphate isomerase-like protein (cupin superfamily)
VDAHDLQDVIDRQASSANPYLEFIREPGISVGLYVLQVGEVDRQSPHTEDEIYYVIEGRGRITVGDETRTVGPGSVVYVAATVPHRFHDISEDLRTLVVFAPAEGSLAAGLKAAGSRAAGSKAAASKA